MEINGKLIEKFEIESGISKAGKEWQKQSILVEQNVDFNKEVVISFFGDKVRADKSPADETADPPVSAIQDDVTPENTGNFILFIPE